MQLKTLQNNEQINIHMQLLKYNLSISDRLLPPSNNQPGLSSALRNNNFFHCQHMLLLSLSALPAYLPTYPPTYLPDWLAGCLPACYAKVATFFRVHIFARVRWSVSETMPDAEGCSKKWLAVEKQARKGRKLIAHFFQRLLPCHNITRGWFFSNLLFSFACFALV